MNADDPDTVRRLVEELSHKGEHKLELVLRPVAALQLAGLVQLALRHPSVDANHAATARRLLAGVGEYFADCPTVLDVLRRGDDPREDRP